MKLNLKDIQKYLFPLKRLFTKYRPIRSVDQVKNFIQEQSAQVSQMTLYGYLKTRMGAQHVIMFEDKDFLSSINIAKWHIYSASLIDCTFFCFSFLYKDKKIEKIEDANKVFFEILNTEKTNKLQELYIGYEAEIIVTDPISSQLIKYLANTYLPMRLSFVNEATRLSSYSGANLIDVLKGVGLDSRIGSHYFRPSPSWGGSCFPKDLVEVNNFYKKDKLKLPLISNIIESNNEHLNWTVNQLLSLKNNNNLEEFVLVGAAFKENTDDFRNSPTLDIYKILDDMGEQVTILDTEFEVPNHNYISSVEDVASKSLISIMYPVNDELDKKLLDYTSLNKCIIYYPWR